MLCVCVSSSEDGVRVKIQCEGNGVLKCDASSLTHYVVREIFDAIPKREAISLNVNLSREMFHVVNRMFSKSLSFLSGILIIRFLVLLSAPICAWAHEHMVLKCFSMKSGLWRTLKSGPLRINHSDSIMHANAVLRHTHVHVSRFSSTRMVFWVGPCFPSMMKFLFALSAVAWTRRWDYLLASSGSFMRSMRALFFCTMLSKLGED